ncbi:MAG: hypothetical protein GY783_20445, partial [Gammaproteobacteria bacterium]|nr:hypothetical protein [Gammaproteobacteria bacterium]
LRERRVLQLASAYIVGSWGLLQFLAFLESRMAVSPHLVNLIGLVLLLLLPSVITLAWVHGRPGKDTWGRTPKVVVPANLLAVSLLMVFLFSGRDLGAVTKTIAIEDENGTVTERVVPKSEYRRRILIYYFENDGAESDAWARETMAYLLRLAIGQDTFLSSTNPMEIVARIQEAGSDDGHDLPRQLQRNVARDANYSHFVTGSITRLGDQWQLTTELHKSDSGRVLSTHTNSAADLYRLADLMSRQLREDLDIPAAHLEENRDLPVAELSSEDIVAVRSLVEALVKVTHNNDWAGAAP